MLIVEKQSSMERFDKFHSVRSRMEVFQRRPLSCRCAVLFRAGISVQFMLA